MQHYVTRDVIGAVKARACALHAHETRAGKRRVRVHVHVHTPASRTFHGCDITRSLCLKMDPFSLVLDAAETSASTMMSASCVIGIINQTSRREG
ncbi:hypothetical protein AMELA_G00099630 [Ameiurus melas]|uniref:Uncharacterized protein n=1 Tax=Ameiurus melas TaxID=219545 RepID=A0A7J6AV72_AMEME|nr:hypothetical protein AMELA_G00099630 [Ameiurus melas]